MNPCEHNAVTCHCDSVMNGPARAGRRRPEHSVTGRSCGPGPGPGGTRNLKSPGEPEKNYELSTTTTASMTPVPVDECINENYNPPCQWEVSLGSPPGL